MDTQEKQPVAYEQSERKPKKRNSVKFEHGNNKLKKYHLPNSHTNHNEKPQLMLETITSAKMEPHHFDGGEILLEESQQQCDPFIKHSDKCNNYIVEELNFDSNECNEKMSRNDTNGDDDLHSDNSFDHSSSMNSEDKNEEIDLQTERNNKMCSVVKKNTIEFLHLHNALIVILPTTSTAYFYGLMNVQVLHGVVEVLGYTLTNSHNSQELYSPRGSSYLYLKSGTCGDSINKPFIQETLKEHTDPCDIISLCNNIENTSAVILCKRINNAKINFLIEHIAQQIFPNTNNIQCNFNVDQEHSNLLEINPELDPIIKSMNSNTRTLLSGGKGVGKSTALRYIINKLLLRYKKVLVIDLDPGQPEFTIPGCLSATIVYDPVFGPNYTHLREPYKSVFVSNIDISAKPLDYLKNVRLLISLCEHVTPMPTIINYMGYTRGFGLNIFSSVVGCVKPSSIINILSSNPARNFSSRLSHRLIYQSAQTLTPNVKKLTNYEIITIPSMTDKNMGWTLEPRKIREMCVLCYFGTTVLNTQKYITDVTSHTYKVEFSAVNLISDDKVVTPAVVNANLVAMCKSSLACASYECYGWGIVRAVDYESKEFYIITPISRDNLELVDSLVLGSVTLPPSMYMASDRVEGTVPYVSKGILPVFGKLTKRSYLPKEHC
ncbi:hypothetical protein RI129_000629 [Pyrocoelia pectoralis]|uniref:Polynucleotide 5'-hydroxyl-kinase NOL9 n=1 Tax=Pyrocoelia pectoralis TaxID=417401 RepID=A0AAN7VII0_9COLE